MSNAQEKHKHLVIRANAELNQANKIIAMSYIRLANSHESIITTLATDLPDPDTNTLPSLDFVTDRLEEFTKHTRAALDAWERAAAAADKLTPQPALEVDGKPYDLPTMYARAARCQRMNTHADRAHLCTTAFASEWLERSDDEGDTEE